MNQSEEWSNAGGCSWKHPLNKERRDECNAVALEKKGSKAYVSKTQADADMLLAQAAAASSKEDKSWSAGQTLMVVGGALVGLTIMTVIIIKIKKAKG